METDTDSAPEITKGRTSQATAPPQVDFVDRVLFWFFLFSFISTLVIFDILQRVALLFGAHYHERIVSLMCTSIVSLLKMVGVQFNIQKNSTMTPRKPYIIIANHQSLFDVPILYTVFDPFIPKFIAKKELTNWIPGISINLRRGNNAIIDRSNPKQAVAEITRIGKFIDQNGFSIVIFPEGTRARDGNLKSFYPIGIAALLKAVPQADVVPVVLEGSWHLTARKFGPFPRTTKITIIVGPQIARSASRKAQEIVNESRAWIEQTLEKIRTLES